MGIASVARRAIKLDAFLALADGTNVGWPLCCARGVAVRTEALSVFGVAQTTTLGAADLGVDNRRRGILCDHDRCSCGNVCDSVK